MTYDVAKVTTSTQSLGASSEYSRTGCHCRKQRRREHNGAANRENER